ncbi:MAG TPA: hypothetical protein VKT29_06735 [Terriglobales bacterium]|nr:hypothetical protein [Terriglobales bacterium]
MEHLIYLACESRNINLQALYAAYSALAWRGTLELAVHVYSDAPAVFQPLGNQVQVHQLSPEQVRAWRGPGNYPFRIKIAALAAATREHGEERVLFADSDTFFFAELAPVFARMDAANAVLHRKEYAVLSNPSGQLQRFRKRMSKFRFRGSAIDLNADMWNSGAIGLHPREFHLLDTVLAFIDSVSPHYKKQLVEQYAVSYFLQKNARLHACDDALFHYWAQKVEYQQVIEGRLQRWQAMPLESALAELRAERIELPPFQPRHGWVRRVSDRVLGREEAQ